MCSKFCLLFLVFKQIHRCKIVMQLFENEVKVGSCCLIIEIEFSTKIYLAVKVNEYIYHGYKKTLEEFCTIPNPPLKCPKYKYLLITINVLVFVIGLFIYYQHKPNTRLFITAMRLF